MLGYKRDFIEFAHQRGVLKFGEFTLKSGRISPWFFNAGMFNDGYSLYVLGRFYAEAIVESGVAFDMLFGPAYKGIPLVSAVSVALYNEHGINVPWAFNRKEAKDHGEGGNIVGAPIKGKVLLIDDVITAGTAIGESLPILNTNDSELAGVCVSVNRREIGIDTKVSAIQQIETDHNIDVISIIDFFDVYEYLAEEGQHDIVTAMQLYNRTYGA